MPLENKGPGGVTNSYGVRSTTQPTKINSLSPKSIYNEFDKGAATVAVLNTLDSSKTIMGIWTGSQAEYDAIASKSATVLYVIV